MRTRETTWLASERAMARDPIDSETWVMVCAIETWSLENFWSQGSDYQLLDRSFNNRSFRSPPNSRIFRSIPSTTTERKRASSPRFNLMARWYFQLPSLLHLIKFGKYMFTVHFPWQSTFRFLENYVYTLQLALGFTDVFTWPSTYLCVFLKQNITFSRKHNFEFGIENTHHARFVLFVQAPVSRPSIVIVLVK